MGLSLKKNLCKRFKKTRRFIVITKPRIFLISIHITLMNKSILIPEMTSFALKSLMCYDKKIV